MAGLSNGEKMLLAVAAFLILKGLLDPKDKDDREKIEKAWKREIEGRKNADRTPLFD